MNIYFIERKKQISALLGILKHKENNRILIISHNINEEKILKQRLAMNNLESKIIRKKNLSRFVSNPMKEKREKEMLIIISQLWKELANNLIFDHIIALDVPSKNVNENLKFLQEFNQIFSKKGFVLIPENKIKMFTQNTLNYNFISSQDIDFVEDRSEELKFVFD
ncbi:MAG: hypothetical protein K8S23_16850 [Candidatus Cloacimonetes bacterium]|nr:hypothetical protein [Candidatus Cloacimonadota bacterium]